MDIPPHLTVPTPVALPRKSWVNSLLSPLTSSFAGLQTRLQSPITHFGIKDPARYAMRTDFDFIICGGGTAGAILASRLSEDQSVNVLLLEEGLSDQLEPKTRIPAAYASLFDSPQYMQDYSTQNGKSTHDFNRTIALPAGKMLGGSSSINGLFYQVPADADLDQWAAEFPECSEWTAEAMRPYFQRAAEKMVIHVPQPSERSATATRFVEGCIQAGLAKKVQHWHGPALKSSPQQDTQQRVHTSIGCALVPTHTTKDSVRCSTSSAYLTNDVFLRGNLTVGVGVKVIKVDLSSSLSQVTGVVISESPSSSTHAIPALREVILCCGALGTPPLLLRSGIGPSAELEMLGIAPLVDSPQVGKGLQDHLRISLPFECSTGTLQPNLMSTLGQIKAFGTWAAWGSGPLASNCLEAAVFFSSSGTQPVSLPDLELMYTPVHYEHDKLKLSPNDPTLLHHHFSILPALLRPRSVGTVSVASATSWDAPVIDANFLSDERDIAAMRAGVRAALRVAESSPLREILVRSAHRGLEYFPSTTKPPIDTELDTFISRYVETVCHSAATCRIGSVVDGHLKVQGLKGLRVVDASVLPRLVAGHPASTVVAIAERAAEWIRQGV